CGHAEREPPPPAEPREPARDDEPEAGDRTSGAQRAARDEPDVPRPQGRELRTPGHAADPHAPAPVRGEDRPLVEPRPLLFDARLPPVSVLHAGTVAGRRPAPGTRFASPCGQDQPPDD